MCPKCEKISSFTFDGGAGNKARDGRYTAQWKCTRCGLRSSVLQLWSAVVDVVRQENILSFDMDVEPKVLAVAAKQKKPSRANSAAPYVDKPTADCLPSMPEEEGEEMVAVQPDEGDAGNARLEQAPGSTSAPPRSRPSAAAIVVAPTDRARREAIIAELCYTRPGCRSTTGEGGGHGSGSEKLTRVYVRGIEGGPLGKMRAFLRGIGVECHKVKNISSIGRAVAELSVVESYVEELDRLMTSRGLSVCSDFDPQAPQDVQASSEEVSRARSKYKERIDREIGKAESDLVRRFYTDLKKAWFPTVDKTRGTDEGTVEAGNTAGNDDEKVNSTSAATGEETGSEKR
jgi:hypothetical protein